jgi:hypothetical protein
MMPSGRFLDAMTRRTFSKVVASGFGVGAAFVHARIGSARTLSMGSSLVVYGFYPIEDGEYTTCKACLAHADNKKFATREAAEAHRAHPGCRCSIMMSTVSKDEYIDLFGDPTTGNAKIVSDRRWSLAPQPAS